MPPLVGFYRQPDSDDARLRRRPAGGHRRGRGHAALRLQRRASLRERYRAIDAAFGGYPHALHYALKANSTLAHRAAAARAGQRGRRQLDLGDRAGAQAPASPPRTSSSPASASRRPSSNAPCRSGLKAINVESAGELARVEAIAARRRRASRAWRIRVNPDIDAKSHPHISTGLQDQQVRRAARRRRASCSPTLAARPRAAAGRRPRPRRVADHHRSSRCARGRGAARRLARSCADAGIALEYVDVGGGLGISYDGGEVPSAAEYVGGARRRSPRRPACRSSSSRAGRSSAPAGVLSRASSTSSRATAASDFAVIDAGHDRADAARRSTARSTGSSRSAPRDGGAAAVRDRRPGLREQRRRRPRPHAAAARRSATSWRFATPAPTDRRWRRTTIAGRCRRKCWSTTARGASSAGARRSRTCWRWKRRTQNVDLSTETLNFRTSDLTSA